jgi:hypothetical protein
MDDLPPLYFRVRENGALVFRVDAGNRQRRMELVQIAVANLRNGEIRAQGERGPTEEETAAIRAWMEARAATLAARERDDVLRMVDQLNLTAQWAQTKATDDQLDAVTDALLLAMHDLRSVLVRRKADRRKGEGA